MNICENYDWTKRNGHTGDNSPVFSKKSVLLNTIRFPRGEMELIKEVDLQLYTEHIDYTLQSLFIQLSSFGL
jgi:hypothetical protein